MNDEILEKQGTVYVRRLKPNDLNVVIRIDAKNTGIKREEYFKLKLRQALAESGVEVSLAAEVDGLVVGFVLCWVYYGEFGQPEAAAVLDTIGVNPNFAHQGVGDAMLSQLKMNLGGLGIPVLRTEVDFSDTTLLGFFHKEGFQPSSRICLDLEIGQ
jgi:ribosomal protein S18 acetylase RimI-like enzyme